MTPEYFFQTIESVLTWALGVCIVLIVIAIVFKLADH